MARSSVDSITSSMRLCRRCSCAPTRAIPAGRASGSTATNPIDSTSRSSARLTALNTLVGAPKPCLASQACLKSSNDLPAFSRRRNTATITLWPACLAAVVSPSAGAAAGLDKPPRVRQPVDIRAEPPADDLGSEDVRLLQ
jgi:hypothetical protein